MDLFTSAIRAPAHRSAEVRIACSGWQYRHWRGTFYPAERFHFGESRYGGVYDDARLDEWGRWLRDRAATGLDVFAYFNNDVGGTRRATRSVCAIV